MRIAETLIAIELNNETNAFKNQLIYYYHHNYHIPLETIPTHQFWAALANPSPCVSLISMSMTNLG